MSDGIALLALVFARVVGLLLLVAAVTRIAMSVAPK